MVQLCELIVWDIAPYMRKITITSKAGEGIASGKNYLQVSVDNEVVGSVWPTYVHHGPSGTNTTVYLVFKNQYYGTKIAACLDEAFKELGITTEELLSDSIEYPEGCFNEYRKWYHLQCGY